MKIIKFNNQMKTIYKAYQKSNMLTLWDAYEKFSHAKQNAFDYCQKLQHDYNGDGGRIIAYNTFGFSYGFTYTDNENKKHFVYITKSNDKNSIIID